MLYRSLSVLALACASMASAQVLVDSIPLPGISQSFWGIHVTPDTIFLGADFNGNVYFYDHDGAQLGTEPTGFTFNHGLIKQQGHYFIAQDYTTNGAHLYEVSYSGAVLLNTWTFPPVIGGNSSGIGDICPDGNAIWYTMYYPDFDVYPYAYAYKWIPGDPTPIDTVPMYGEQPQGIALKGDTLFYVTDNLNGDEERIYVYDLASEQHIGSVLLPDPDGDQSPRGLHCDGTYLYLVANRSGGAASAYQTIFIYALDAILSAAEASRAPGLASWPTPADAQLIIDGPPAGSSIALMDARGRVLLNQRASSHRSILDVSSLPAGVYTVIAAGANGERTTSRCVISR